MVYESGVDITLDLSKRVAIIISSDPSKLLRPRSIWPSLQMRRRPVRQGQDWIAQRGDSLCELQSELQLELREDGVALFGELGPWKKLV
jgi:hypothetical protein